MRFGRRHQPFYRLVVVPRRSKPKRAKYVEKLGWVNPLKHEQSVDKERVLYWLGQGAQPSDSAWNLFVREGIVEGSKRRKGRVGKKKGATAEGEAEVKAEETTPKSGDASDTKKEGKEKQKGKEETKQKQDKTGKDDAGGSQKEEQASEEAVDTKDKS